MQLILYADESGTHDKTGMQPGSEVAVIAGYAAKVDSWRKFCKDWHEVLQKYSAPYFHFSEFAEASSVTRRIRSAPSHHHNNPYFDWKIEQLDRFLLELARVAASGSKVPVGGYVDTRGYAQYLEQNTSESLKNPYEGGAWWFYDSAVSTIGAKWPKLQGPMDFFFDQTDDAEWRNAITNVHHHWKKRISRIKAISFADKKDHYPLQAADMVAYRLRQIAGKYCKYDPKVPNSIPELDRLLFGQFGIKEFSGLFPVQSR